MTGLSLTADVEGNANNRECETVTGLTADVEGMQTTGNMTQ